MGKDKAHRFADVCIQSIGRNGNGLGLAERPPLPCLNVEIPFTAPGDVVKAALLSKKKGVYQGKLTEILTPSPERITPRCVHFGVCGGCRFQHFSYEKQLAIKTALIQSCFENLISDQVSLRPIVPCEDPWEYRNKMEFSFSSDLAGSKYLGLIMNDSKGKVFNLSECHLVDRWFSDAVKTTRHWWNETNLKAYRPSQDAGSLRLLTLREGIRTGDRLVMLTVSGNPDFALSRQEIESFVASLRDAIEPVDPNSSLSIFLRIQQISKGTATNFYEMLLYGPGYIREILRIGPKLEEFTFHISPTAFFQPNTHQAEKFYSLILEMAGLSKDSVVYDLYCGTGAIGICMSKSVKQVIGVELFPEAVLDAKTNAKQNQTNNVHILCGAVRHILSQIEENTLPRPDIVIVDPPRSGLDPDALRLLAALNAQEIVYVSCNPITQSVNIQDLIHQGYHIKAIQPVDQFPHTMHIENIVILTKAK